MHTLLKLLMVVLLCGLWVGCGGGPGEVTMPAKREGPSFQTNQAGAAAPADNTATAAATPGFGQPVRKGNLNLPSAAVGGGGGGSQAAMPPSGGTNPPAGASNVANASTGPFTAETKANGLFPQIPGSGNATAGFGGALFPLATTGGGSGTAGSIGSSLWSRLTGGGSSNSEPKATVTPEGGEAQGMMGQAIKQFSELGNEQTAVQSLYTHLLSNPGEMRKYPLKWYSGINQPRVVFRWGIGIVYVEPSAGLDGRHPVLGDPGGDSGGGGGGGFDGGNAGLEGGDAPPPGASRNETTSERKYKDVNTARPDGFVLYYTGEMGEMVIDALDKRRRHSDAFYGELLKDIPIHQPTEPAKQTAANTNSGRGSGGTPSGFGQPTNAKGRNLPGAAVGGGGDAGSPVQPPPGSFGTPGVPPGGNAAGGDAEAASSAPKEAPARVLDRAMGTGDSAKPDPNMTGTIIPGVMLVGMGKKAALVEKAKQMDLDALIVFNVTVSKTRSSGKTSSMTKMTIINLQDSDKEVVHNSKALKDTIVAGQKEKGQTPVKSLVDVAFKENADTRVDEDGVEFGFFKAAELPSGLNAENVKNRVNHLVTGSGSHPLPTAIEILSYRQQGLVDDQLAIDSLNKIFGDDTIGSILVSGDQRARAKAIAVWVLQNGTSEEDDDL